MNWKILVGDVREKLEELPAGSVQCCVTSPPYWGLRDYGAPGQIGLEATPDLYVAALVEVFAAAARVLADDGTLWLNLGDSYATRWSSKQSEGRAGFNDDRIGRGGKTPAGLKDKDLVGIPWRVAFALQAAGWYLRSDIIWHKPNPMPESVSDRPTKAHEYIFLLTKSARYTTTRTRSANLFRTAIRDRLGIDALKLITYRSSPATWIQVGHYQR